MTAWNVAAYDNRDYSWRCKNGHSFSASPANRSKGTDCPYCKGKLPVVGVNDLATICPSVAAEWDIVGNKGLLPEHFLPNSHEEVCWRCNEGHEWAQKIYERTNGSQCPYCKRRKPIVGEDDLLTKAHHLASYWSYSKNKKKPEEYFSDSSATVWWECDEGHSFRFPIYEMAIRWRCPNCERRHSKL